MSEGTTDFLRRQAVSWWPAIHRGTVYVGIAAATALSGQLEHVKDWSELRGVQSLKILLLVAIASGNATLAFLNTTVSQIRNGVK